MSGIDKSPIDVDRWILGHTQDVSCILLWKEGRADEPRKGGTAQAGTRVEREKQANYFFKR